MDGTESHLVYAGGPPCAESCPGEWSQYHDGYSWGYEKGLKDAREKAFNRVSEIPSIYVNEEGIFIRTMEDDISRGAALAAILAE